MKRQFFLIIILIGYSCQTQESKKNEAFEPYRIEDTTLANLTHEDSVQIHEADKLFNSIKIPPHWVKVNNAFEYIDISHFAWDVTMVYEFGDSGAVLKIVDVKNFPDSICIKTVDANGENKKIWTFKDHKHDTARWTLETTKTKCGLGQFISRPQTP